MLVPISISLTQIALKVKGNKTLISSSYIAYFGHGREKVLNKKNWVLSSLVKKTDVGFGKPITTRLYNNTCCLYYRDWSKVPTFGLWDKHYPTTNVLPKEITDLLPKNFK